MLRAVFRVVCAFMISMLVATAGRSAETGPGRDVRPVSTPSAPQFAKPIGTAPGELAPQAGEHPLQPLIRWGTAAADAFRQVKGYSCTLVKRERINGELGRYERLDMKVRHEPFSVYVSFPRAKGKPSQEVIFVDGQNNGMMWAHSDRFKMMGTASLYPDGRRALQESRYPLTEAGMLNLIERLVSVAKNDSRYGECDVKIDRNAKIDERPCMCIAVTHPTPRKQFRFHHARVYIDSQLHVPVRYESYSWPQKAGDKPILLEEYTYLNYQFDRPLDDKDFDIRNPAYAFPEPDKISDGELASE